MNSFIMRPTLGPRPFAKLRIVLGLVIALMLWNTTPFFTSAASAQTSESRVNGSIDALDDKDVDPVELELRIQRLIQELDAPTRTARERAEQSLTEIGSDVLRFLPAVNPSTSAETKERLTRVRRILQRAASEAMLRASRVTLKGEFTVEQLLSEIKKQTHNQVLLYRGGPSVGERQVSVDFQDTEFWSALDQSLDQAGLTTYNFTGRQRTLGIMPRAEGSPSRANEHASYAGQFRIEATEIQTNRSLRNPTANSMRMRIEVMWEPRTLPVLIRQAYSDVELTADDGSKISVAATQGASEATVLSTVAGVDIILPIELPDRSIKQIASVKGTMTALTPGRIETFEFENLSKAQNVRQQLGGVEVVLERVRKNGSVYEIRLRLTLLDESASFQSHLDWASGNEAYLVDASGGRVDNPNIEKYRERDRSIGYAYLFPVSGDLSGYRLVYRTPAAIFNVPLDYELKNLDLP